MVQTAARGGRARIDASARSFFRSLTDTINGAFLSAVAHVCPGRSGSRGARSRGLLHRAWPCTRSPRQIAGRRDTRPGKFEIADGGTLFLDEASIPNPATEPGLPSSSNSDEQTVLFERVLSWQNA